MTGPRMAAHTWTPRCAGHHPIGQPCPPPDINDPAYVLGDVAPVRADPRFDELEKRAADLTARAEWLEAQIKGITDTDMWQLGRVAALRIKAGRSQPGDAEVLADAFEALTRYIARLREHSNRKGEVRLMFGFAAIIAFVVAFVLHWAGKGTIPFDPEGFMIVGLALLAAQVVWSWWPHRHG